MPNWILKTVIQRFIGWLPWSHRCNEFFQIYVTRGLELTPQCFEAKLNCCRTHFENYQRFSAAPKRDFAVMELGTGWFPIIPIGLFLCGAAEVWTFDIVPLVRWPHYQQVTRLFRDYDREKRLAQFLPCLKKERMAALLEAAALAARHRSPRLALESLNIHLRVEDARQSGLPTGGIDFIFSNTSLEHIPARELFELFTEFRRIASPNAVMSHHVGLADQFSFFDRSITPFNFLRYPASTWRWLDNPIIPQNRLRISDYRALLRNTGHLIVDERNTLGKPAELQSITLAPEFRDYRLEDLLVLYSWIVATPDPGWVSPAKGAAPGMAHASGPTLA